MTYANSDAPDGRLQRSCRPDHPGDRRQRSIGLRAARYGLFLLMLATMACRGSKHGRPSEHDASTSPATPLPATPDGLPDPDSFPRTTSPAIALGALDDRIAALERLFPGNANQNGLRAQLIPMLISRARFLGKLDDYGRALDHAEALVQAAPKDTASYVARAQILASLHRFAAAEADLDQAVALGAIAGDFVMQRIQLAQARGQLDEAVKDAQNLVDKYPNFTNLIALAVIHGQRGEISAAENGFRAALAAWRDDSPFNLTWMCFQWGFLYEQNSMPSRARYLYEIAHAHLPQYAEATGHLAGLLAQSGETARARQLLDGLVTSSNDPEYVGQLAEIESKLGNSEHAAQLVTQASARFEDLLARFPEAFADHAARYFLAAGNNPTRAFELAKRNLVVRQTAAAHTLALESALRLGASTEACSLAESASQVAYPSKQLLFQIWRAFSACGRAEKAREVAARLGIDDSSAP